MDALEVAKDITVAITSNPNRQPGKGKAEGELFGEVLKAVVKVIKAIKDEAPERSIPTLKTMG